MVDTASFEDIKLGENQKYIKIMWREMLEAVERNRLRPGHTGPDNKNENENDKSVRPRLVEMLQAERPCSFNQSRACIFIVLVFLSCFRYQGLCDRA